MRITLAVVAATIVSALSAAPASATTFNWDGLLPDLGNNNCVNYNTIRGQWIYQGQTRGGDPSYYSMSGSLKAHVT